jgi:cobalt-zinc-cadmium efflux system protein
MHDHQHTHSVSAQEVTSKAFVIGIALNALYVVAEIVAGLLYNSLSLLTDAGHNIGDVASLLLSLIAFRLARKKATTEFTYGYKKATVIAALTNAVILLIAMGVIGYESVMRLSHPQAVEGGKIAWVAGAGIVVNSISAYLFYKNKESDLNAKGAYLHLLADALVSIGVVVAGVLISFTGWYWLDPVASLVVMLFILVSTWSLLKDSFKLSIDAVPPGIEVESIIEKIKQLKGVRSFHHVHVWPLSTTENALTAHLIADEAFSFQQKMVLVRQIKHELEHLNIHHSTIELDNFGEEH